MLVPKDCPPFAVNNKHLHYLVTQGYLALPECTEEELGDRSKLDTMGKIITCLQVSYLVIATIAHAHQGLAITTLELSALAIAVCSIMTSMIWLRKPTDVHTPNRLNMETPMADICLRAGPAARKDYKQTPLDFVDDLKPSWGLNIQTFMKMPVAPHERPMPRFPNDRLPHLSEAQQAFLCIACLIYAGIHLAGWNFSFSTRAEKILWRVCSMFIFGNTAAFWILETVAAYWRYGAIQRVLARLLGRSSRISQAHETEDNVAANQGSADATEEAQARELPMPVEFWSIFPLAFTYAVARAYLIVETFLGLRELEGSAFINVEWSNYVPHL